MNWREQRGLIKAMKAAEIPTAARGTGAVESRTARGRTLNTLCWALGIPVVAAAAGFLTQYPYRGLWAGVVVVLAVVAAAAVMAGGVWNRAGAATLASAVVLALPMFAGPTLYEVYAKRLGTPVDAVVLDTGQDRNSKGTALDTCSVADTSGERSTLSERQNCHGQFAVGAHVVLFKDPAGLLDPWVQETRSRSVDTVSLPISAGLFATAAATLL
ncbi:hypothetical protein ACWCPS_39035 [Streptomyces mauvecolor]